MTKQQAKRQNRKFPIRHPAWNAWQGLFLILVVYLIEYPLGWLHNTQDLNTLTGLLRFVGIGFAEAFLYFGAVALFFRLIRRPWGETGFRRTKFVFLLLGVFIGIILFLVVGLMGNLLMRLLGTPVPQSFAEAVKGASYTWELGLLLVLGGLVAPLKEELIFRGLLYPPLRETYGKGKGILLTGLFFATLHLDLVRFLPLFLGGVVLAWLYECTGSLWPTVVAHGTWNTLMALALWWGGK